MCGIAGLYGRAEAESIRAMTAAMIHRGPDDSGIWSDATTGIALGNTRLAIQDLSAAGHMPMTDGRNWITYNGEVYNFLDLRQELEKYGHTFESRGDTEIILAAYRQWGAGCLEHLRGMFAFAIFDPDRGGRLFLARDHFGIKPLYWSQTTNAFLFASEIRALLASGLLQRRLDRQAAWGYLSVGSVIPPRTIVQNVNALLPGHALVIEAGKVRIWQWWDLVSAAQRANVPPTLEEAAREVRRLLEESIRLQMIADVPVGAFLSGGIDSTTIVGLMSAIASRPVHTYSVAFETAEGTTSELPYARIASQQFGTVHEEIVVTEQEVAGSFDTMVDALDQPSIDGINSFMVSKAARRGVTVALSGLGGDELFAGYPQFGRFVRATRLSPTGGRFLADMLKVGGIFLPGRLRFPLEFLAASPVGRHRHVRQFFSDQEKRAMLSPDWLDGIDPESIDTFYSELLLAGLDPVSQVSYVEVRGYMAHTLLRDTDAMSMAHSLEVRVPFVDHVLAEFVFALPPAWKWHEGRGKLVLRQAVGDLLPKDIVGRKKMGFDLPLGTWLRGILYPRFQETLTTPTAQEMLSAGIRDALVKRAASNQNYPLWSLLVLLRWLSIEGINL